MTKKENWDFIILNSSYWDCECETKFIHLKTRLNECLRCNTKANEQPDSRAIEVKHMYDINEGWV